MNALYGNMTPMEIVAEIAEFGPRPEPTVDPTRIDIDSNGANPWSDPLIQRMRGVAYHGNTPFDVPFVSHVEGNLYQGGCENGLVLPSFIKHVVSLYKWEAYTIPESDDPPVVVTVTMYDDSAGPDYENILELATTVHDFCEVGPTLVHCQAGLNRSGLVAGAALVLGGYTPEEAIRLLRDNRSPAVLCNKTFEAFLLEFAPGADV